MLLNKKLKLMPLQSEGHHASFRNNVVACGYWHNFLILHANYLCFCQTNICYGPFRQIKVNLGDFEVIHKRFWNVLIIRVW
jgi:hypothetical protein